MAGHGCIWRPLKPASSTSVPKQRRVVGHQLGRRRRLLKHLIDDLGQMIDALLVDLRRRLRVGELGGSVDRGGGGLLQGLVLVAAE